MSGEIDPVAEALARKVGDLDLSGAERELLHGVLARVIESADADVDGFMFPATTTQGMVMNAIDVCRTPMAPTPIPIPYPILDSGQTVSNPAPKKPRR